MDFTRRAIVGTGLAGAVATFLLPPERAFALAPGDWTLGVADIENDIGAEPMRRVSGRAPTGLEGILFRNGPAKFRRPGGSARHWFDGDGLVRRFAIHDGKAEFSARFVDTEKRRQDTFANAVVTPGFGTPMARGARLTSPDSSNAANTSVMVAGDEIWALWESGSPYRLNPASLETIGPKSLRTDLAHMPFSAHPRTEPDGTVWNLGISDKRAIVWKLDRSGKLHSAHVIDLPLASYIHDFTATARHLVIVLQPWIFRGGLPPFVNQLSWRPDLGTKILVLDKDDLSRRRIFELPAFSFFHMGDAWEEKDGTIRFDICAADDPSFGQSEAGELLVGKHRGTDARATLAMIALRADGSGDIAKTPYMTEFPQSDRRRSGLARRYTIATGLYGTDRPLPQGIQIFDWRLEKIAGHNFGARHLVEEFLFVPRGSAEGEGWLVGTTINLDAKATELHVLDTRAIDAGPVVTWRASMALPVGFHGTWCGLR